MITNYSEHICSTKLIGRAHKRDLQKAFDHANCPVRMKERANPVILDDQGLRNLRHRLAHKEDGHFASCPHCSQEFSYENLVALYCRHLGNIEIGSDVAA